MHRSPSLDNARPTFYDVVERHRHSCGAQIVDDPMINWNNVAKSGPWFRPIGEDSLILKRKLRRHGIEVIGQKRRYESETLFGFIAEHYGSILPQKYMARHIQYWPLEFIRTRQLDREWIEWIFKSWWYRRGTMRAVFNESLDRWQTSSQIIANVRDLQMYGEEVYVELILKGIIGDL